MRPAETLAPAKATPGAGEAGELLRVKGHPFCNQTLRYWGIRLTPHLACSFTCEATIAWGEWVWWLLAQELDPKAARDLRFLLERPFRWDGPKGVAIVDTPFFRGITNSLPCYPACVVEYEAVAPEVYWPAEMGKWASPGLTYPCSLFLAAECPEGK